MAKRFWGTQFHMAGMDSAVTMQGRVVNVNTVNWTVDVVSQYDRHYYRDIQVSALYLHYNQGEGVYILPDVGAVCMITIPSDTSPPFVSGFVAPMEVVGGTEKPLENPDDAIVTTIFGTQEPNQAELTGSDAPDGTTSHGGKVPYPQVTARFDAGRPPGKPGDLWLRGRDGNFVVLHRGGVLQVGATEIAQRMYIPLANKILDISGFYEHMNVGGGVQWGLQEGPSVENPPAQHMQTYRVFANDQFCDIRIATGKVFSPVGEPDGDAGFSDEINALHLGTDELIVCEVTVAKGGFKAGSGDVASGATHNQTKLRFFYDRGGNIFLRAEGSAFFGFKKDLKVRVVGNAALKCKQFTLDTDEGFQVLGGPLVEIKGDVVRLQAGTQPIARQGDSVAIVLPVAQVSGTVSGNPFTGTITLVTPLYGSIISGNPNLLG